MRLNVVGCSPAWPNPGGAQSGYLLEGPGRLLMDCGPGVLARLRSSTNGTRWPHVDAIAITHFHLDHWGDLVPWVWGTMWGLGRDYAKPELWLPPGGIEELAAFGIRFGTPDMFSRVFEPKEYAEGEEFEAAGLRLVPTRLPHYTVQTYGFRVSNTTRTLAYSGDSGPSDRLEVDLCSTRGPGNRAPGGVMVQGGTAHSALAFGCKNHPALPGGADRAAAGGGPLGYSKADRPVLHSLRLHASGVAG